MTRIWDDRLAEVWADPGKAGAGVVVGDDAVLTARHVVAEVGADGLVLARVVRPDAPVPRWIPMTILAVDADWDIALLRVRDNDIDDGAEAAALEPGWETPSSPSPVFVRLGTAVERDCEAVGFPRSEVQQLDRSPAGTVRQTEQIRGTLHPAGQGKRPVNPDRQLPLRWMPLDVDGATPKKQKSWGGMSGAGVVLSDGRLAGLVTSAESAHQQRRLYVVPLADVLDRSPRFAEQLSLVLGGRAIAETRNAPRNRDVLQAECLNPDGLPVPVAEAGLDAFGMKPAGVPGEPPFLAYVPRDKDEALREGIQRAQREHRMLLIVGGSAGGKSRSAAETAKVLLGNHRLVCPQPAALVQLRDRDPDQARRWYQQAVDAGDTQGLIGFGYLLQDSDPEQARHRYQQAAEAGDKDGMYNLGKALADSDPEAARRWFKRAAEVGHVHAMYRLGRLVVDRNRDRAIRWWKRAAKAGLTDAMVGLGVLYTDQNLAQARRWFQQAADAGEPAGLAGLGNLTAATDPAEARRLWERAAEAGNTGGMFNLGNALASSDPDQARRWFQRAAEVGNSENPDPGSIRAMVNLGAMIAESDPDQARHWFQRAAEANDVQAMVNLSILLADSDPEQARHWRNRAIASTDQDR